MSEEQVHIQGRFNQTDNPDMLRVYEALREQNLTQGQIIELGMLALGALVLENFSVQSRPYLDYLKQIGGKNNDK